MADLGRSSGGGFRLLHRRAPAWAFALVVLASTLGLPPAASATPYTNVASAGPLSEIMLAGELSCQVRHVQDRVDEFYPPTTRPGDCGTFLVADGALYAPDFRSHGGTATGNLGAHVPWTPVAQSVISGTGTAPDPLRVTTVADAGASGLRVTQVDSYVVGERFYRSDVTVTWTGAGDKAVILYRAGDCYLGGSDNGYGYLDAASGTIGCATNPNDVPTDRYIKWIPISGGSRYYQSFYGSVWQWIGGKTAFPDTCDCSTFQDNGAGLSWSFTVPAGGSVTRSHYTSFGVPSRPVFQEPSPCVSDEFVRGAVGVPLSFGLQAAETDDTRTLTLAMVAAPVGLAFAPGPAGNPTTGTATWADPTIGYHTATFRATDDIGQEADCQVTLDIRAPEAQATALAAWAAAAVPASAEWRTQGVDLDAPSAAEHRALVVTFPDAQLEADGAEETGSIALAGRAITAQGSTQLAHARLLGGLVELRGLENAATVTFDPAAPSPSSVAASSSIASIAIGGVPVVLTGGPQTIALPGGGELRLHERATVVTATGALYREDLVRAYLPTPYGRMEVILGSLVVQAGATIDRIGQDRRILDEDDARTGGDVGDDLGSAHPLQSGVYDGTVSDADRVDVYRTPVQVGENVKVVLAPAARATAAGGSAVVSKPPLVSPVSPGADLSPIFGWELVLYDPTHTERDRFVATLEPLTVELNADVSGDWYVEVVLWPGIDSGARNYTLALATTPAPLLPEAETGALGDAPAACAPGGAGLPELRQGPNAGVIGVTDDVDVYRFHASLGELASLVLKPGEGANAVAMDLAVYDESCALLARSGTRLDGAKGFPQSHAMLPVQASGEYIVAVERVNGIGNYVLQLAVVDPLPTLPANDAGTGQDAPSDPSDPSTSSAPPAFQGRIDDGDAGDAYLVPLVAGRQATLAVHGSALSAFHIALRGPSGAIVGGTHLPGAATYAWRPVESGPHSLVIAPLSGGGNYLVAWGQAPA